MSRRRRLVTHSNHDRWLVSYADFITLLFAFFVVLYSSSQVDQRKVGKLAFAIQVAFQELGVFSPTGAMVPNNTSEPLPVNSVQMLDNVSRTATLGRIAPATEGFIGAGTGTENGDLDKLRSELSQALAPEIQRQEVALHHERDGLVISLREIGFFGSGSAEFKSSSQPAVDRIAGTLRTRPYDLRIEGHTDNIPIHNLQFASNWELSTARATELIRLFIVKYGFPPDRLSAAGYAEFHPVARNTTASGRQLNRRVDIVILHAHVHDVVQSPPRAGVHTQTAPSPPTP